MLLWWIISLIILIACIIFAYRMIVSTYEFLPADKRYFLRFYKSPVVKGKESGQPNTLKVLNKKVQSVEDNTIFYQMQFLKLQTG